MEAELIGILFTVFSALFFSLNVILMRKALVTGEARDALMAVVFIGVGIFLPVAVGYSFFEFSLSVRGLFFFMIAGILGMFLGRFLFYEGAKRVGASRTVPISRGSLLVASFFGYLFLNETITEGHLLGILLLSAGVILVSKETKSGSFEYSQRRGLDLLFPIGSMLFFGLGSFLIKLGLSDGTYFLWGLAIQFTTALLTMMIYYSWKGISFLRPFQVKEKYLYLSAGVLYAIAMGLFYLGLRISRLVVVVPIRGITPLITLVFSYLYLKKIEELNYILAFGAFLVVGGAVLVGYFM